jgi:hypothetical protein
MRRGLYLLFGLAVTRVVFAVCAPSPQWPLPVMIPLFLGVAVGLAIWMVILITLTKRPWYGAVPTIVMAVAGCAFAWPAVARGAGAVTVLLATAVALLSCALLQVSKPWGWDRRSWW